MELTHKQSQLFDFVKQRHGDQKRKYTGDPYWTHLLSVANIVNIYCPNESGLIEIALCHDLFEDTETNTMDLGIVLSECGYEQLEKLWIIHGVEALTDVFTTEYRPEWNRSFRKQWECARLAKISPEYQTVKYADLIHNTYSIIEFDKGFAKKYLAEKRAILDVMRLGNMDLLIECYHTLVKADKIVNN